MRSTKRALIPLIVSATGWLLIAGCGIQTSAPEALQPEMIPGSIVLPVPTQALASPSPSVTIMQTLRLWLVRDDGLVAVHSDLPVGTQSDLVLKALAVEATPAQTAAGLRTVARDPITGQALVTVVPMSPTPSAGASPSPVVEPATVTVQVSQAFAALLPAEQVLLLGQVVLSLTGAGERSVGFVDDAGAPLAVPLPDGRLLDVPATARDYGTMIAQP